MYCKCKDTLASIVYTLKETDVIEETREPLEGIPEDIDEDILILKNELVDKREEFRKL